MSLGVLVLGKEERGVIANIPVSLFKRKALYLHAPRRTHSLQEHGTAIFLKKLSFSMEITPSTRTLSKVPRRR